MASGIVRKTWVTIAGVSVVLVGVALLVLPGPGLVTIAAGLTILATEFVWAQKLMEPVKRRLERAKTNLTATKNAGHRSKDQ